MLYGSGEEEPWNSLNAVELNDIADGRTNNETAPFRGGESRSFYVK